MVMETSIFGDNAPGSRSEMWFKAITYNKKSMKPILEQGNIRVAGINKVQRFSNLNLNKYFQYGLVAQLVAQLLCKQKVTGSRPVSSTTHSCYPMRLKLPKERSSSLPGRTSRSLWLWQCRIMGRPRYLFAGYRTGIYGKISQSLIQYHCE